MVGTKETLNEPRNPDSRDREPQLPRRSRFPHVVLGATVRAVSITDGFQVELHDSWK